MSKMKLFLSASALIVISGCADNSALIKASCTSIRNDVFEEVSNGGPPPAGYADLSINSSFKTHKPGIYSAKDIHGTPEYMLLLNIDGQAVQLQGSLREENTEPRGHRDPEAGEGVRYGFSKNLRLCAKTHKVVIAIPSDNIAVQREIYLPEESRNCLVIEPAYGAASEKQRPGFYGITSFEKGIKGFRVTFNGKPL